jgi:hypothetical protein
MISGTLAVGPAVAIATRPRATARRAGRAQSVVSMTLSIGRRGELVVGWPNPNLMII